MHSIYPPSDREYKGFGICKINDEIKVEDDSKKEKKRILRL